MTEAEARALLVDQHGVDVVAKLDLYVAMLTAESERQNLIARSTLPSIWSRHILDCAQLDDHLPNGTVLDIGSGAGLPGIVLATMRQGVTLIEPRRKRVEFLQTVVSALDLRATVVHGSMETFGDTFAGITARAVASLDRLLNAAFHLSTASTRWVLPKGQGAASELADAKANWSGQFHVEQSVTDSSSGIIIASDVKRRLP